MTGSGSVGALRTESPAATIKPLVWALWLVSIVSPLLTALVWAIDGFPPLPLSFARGAIGVIVLALDAVVFGTVGALLAARFPRNAVGWLLLAVALVLAVLMPANLAIEQAFQVARLVPATTATVAWLMSTFATPVGAAMVVLVLLLFPDGRFVSARWSVGAVMTVAGTGMLALASAFDPSGLVWYPALPNPTALPRAFEAQVELVRLAGVVALVLAVAVAVISMTIRYQRADDRVQLQLRWIVVGVAVMLAGFLPFLLARYVFPVGDASGEFLVGVAGLATCCFPLAIAIAIVRQHLFDIDVLIGRTLVYVPLMGFLAGLYTASVALFQRVFISLTGNTSDTSIVLSALVLAGVFAPARSSLEAKVARRFKPLEPTHPQAAPVDPAAVVAQLEERLEKLERHLAELQICLPEHVRPSPGRIASHGRGGRASAPAQADASGR